MNKSLAKTKLTRDYRNDPNYFLEFNLSKQHCGCDNGVPDIRGDGL